MKFSIHQNVCLRNQYRSRHIVNKKVSNWIYHSNVCWCAIFVSTLAIWPMFSFTCDFPQFLIAFFAQRNKLCVLTFSFCSQSLRFYSSARTDNWMDFMSMEMPIVSSIFFLLCFVIYSFTSACNWTGQPNSMNPIIFK